MTNSGRFLISSVSSHRNTTFTPSGVTPGAMMIANLGQQWIGIRPVLVAVERDHHGCCRGHRGDNNLVGVAPPANLRAEATATSIDRAATAKRAETNVRTSSSTAVVAYDELGIARASASEIARRCRALVGGDPVSLRPPAEPPSSHPRPLDRSLRRAARHVVLRLESSPSVAACSSTGLWSQMATSHYRTSLEIQLHLHRHPAASVGHHAGARRAADVSRDLSAAHLPRHRPGAGGSGAGDGHAVTARVRGLAWALGADDTSSAGGRDLLADSGHDGPDRPLGRS